ncbi:PTS glucose transporter subunit IIA [Buchnera aphidicola]|uniref:PTS system glucose-specific EIIA component n=1 Tax=Buchnera aphidicola (Therioaphis trifolii) TaxID=1241884 RepID=A0A4D6YPC6_9GAMM|nr:PTS glucose transporter subunit IIA [Buchnera aphidicola]QCI27055.1 PTS glucose transporter subunit IIA [Buchnera aphidicola (Therioaphis trifolii)]
MNLFSKLFKNNNLPKKNKIFSPISGTIINIESVPDEVFSKKIIGDGVAIKPSGKKIVSPVKGKIGTIFKTKHAFSILSEKNIEIFVHFGIDTILLNGKGFKKIAKENQYVNIGDIILEYNLNFLNEHSKSTLTPVVISNMEKIKTIKKYSGRVIAGKTPIMEIIYL